MGPISELLKTLPGLPKGIEGQIDERELASAEEILGAMTPEERLNPDLLIDEPRRARVAAAAGQPIAEVNSLIAQFYQARRFFSGDPPTPA